MIDLNQVPQATRKLASDFVKFFGDRPSNIDVGIIAQKLAALFHEHCIQLDEATAIAKALEYKCKFMPTIAEVMAEIEVINYARDQRKLASLVTMTRDLSVCACPPEAVDRMKAEGWQLEGERNVSKRSVEGARQIVSEFLGRR
jgi:hypothetical protein